MPYRILFVCLGNICRSPSAEGIMRHLIRQHQLEQEIICDSAGTASYHIGSSPDPRMTEAAATRGIVLTGAARQFQRSDFQAFDLILAMDRDNYADILRLAPSKEDETKVRMMCEFCRHHRDREVPDPYYGGIDGFQYVVDLLLDACEGLLEHISAVHLTR
ncbi:MAG: low molecular weight protein-tyrosine-phosphatase [Synechococcales bacterium]|nr:low molecular weight protein-tyrosine-phosphatase [Synechococcales bacterium]